MLCYLRLIFAGGFRRFLIHGNSSYVVLYIQCLRYNICSAWFLDIRISTCSDCICFIVDNIAVRIGIANALEFISIL